MARFLNKNDYGVSLLSDIGYANESECKNIYIINKVNELVIFTE